MFMSMKPLQHPTALFLPFLCILFGLPRAFAQSQPPLPSPEIALSINGTPAPQNVQGEPLVLTVVVFNPDIFDIAAVPLQINAQNGSWANTAQITVTNSAGASVTWPLQAIRPPGGTLVLDDQQLGTLQWVLPSSAAQAIAPDTYQILAVMDTTRSAGTTGWSGTVSSDPAYLQVSSPSSPSPAQMAQKLRSQAIVDHILANNSQAINDLDLLLAQNPSSTDALTLKANFLASQGQNEAALAAYEQALQAFNAQNPDPPEPPTTLLRATNSLRQLIFNSGSQPAETTTTVTPVFLVFNPSAHAINLTAHVSSTSAAVTGGTVTFTVTGLGSPATSNAVTQGNASVLFSVPGGTQAGSYPIVATYSGTAAFSGSTDSTEALVIHKATPVITWSNPADVYLGIALGAAQLDATASVPGMFAYTPPAGTVLPLGSGQPLSAVFSPSDMVDYNSAGTGVLINVKKLVGDLNEDGSVGCDDIAIVKASFGKKVGQPGFDPRADVNGDGVVNVLDLSFVARQLPEGTTCH
jgi:hypothetical protein